MLLSASQYFDPAAKSVSLYPAPPYGQGPGGDVFRCHTVQLQYELDARSLDEMERGGFL